MTEARNYIGGGWVPPRSGESFLRRSPLDDSDLGPYADSDERDVDAAATAAAAAASAWGKTSIPERAAAMHRLAGVIERHASELAQAMTDEEGKRISEGYGETSYAVSLLRYFAGYILASEGLIIPGSEFRAFNLYRRRPIGPVALVTPWNFPLLVPLRKMAPALAFGNPVIWKPASDAPATACLFVRLVDEEAGLPPGVVNLVTGRSHNVGNALVRHPGIRAVSFTGSTATGRRVQSAGFVREEPIRVQVEMGGKNVLIVTDDADTAFAAKVAIDGIVKGSGQRCTATGLVLVQAAALDSFVAETGDKIRALRVGPGADAHTDVTPLVSRDQLERAQRIVDRSVAMGLTPAAKAPVPHGLSGWFMPPALMTGTTPAMPVSHEEIFAPVLPVASYQNDDQAIAWANSLPYGLSASIVTSNIARALRFVDDIQAGVVKVNQETGSSEPNFPFGGWKSSGYGPMEQGPAAAQFYTEEQTIHLVPGPLPAELGTR